MLQDYVLIANQGPFCHFRAPKEMENYRINKNKRKLIKIHCNNTQSAFDLSSWDFEWSYLYYSVFKILAAYEHRCYVIFWKTENFNITNKLAISLGFISGPDNFLLLVIWTIYILIRHLSNIGALWPVAYFLSTKKKNCKKKKKKIPRSLPFLPVGFLYFFSIMYLWINWYKLGISRN